ncbi:MAG: hypothetical protein ACOX2O_04475 [Bdellovibrionota bacterium]|jgi:hypothetical protein
MFNTVSKKLKLLSTTPPWEWPMDVDKILLSIITDKNTPFSDRLRGVDLAGELSVINLELVQALQDIISSKDESYELRGAAISSIGAILEEVSSANYLNEITFIDSEEDLIKIEDLLEIRDLLHNIFNDTSEFDETRRRALESAVRTPEEWTKAAVEDAYKSSDVAWKVTALYCMRYLPNFKEEVLAELTSINPEMKRYAVEAVAAHKFQEAWPKLKSIILSEYSDKDLLDSAIYAAVKIKGSTDLLTELPELNAPELKEIVLSSAALEDFSDTTTSDADKT